MDIYRGWRRLALVFLALLTAGTALPGRAQELSRNSDRSNGLAATSAEPGPSLNFPLPQKEPRYSGSIDPGDDLELTWKKAPRKFLADQKEMWLFPTQLARGRHWLPTAIIVGGTAVFIKKDPPLERKIRGTDIFDGYNSVLKGAVSGGIITAVPAGFYVISLLRKDSYGQSTSLLAGEAVANDFVLMATMKVASRRTRPAVFPPESRYNDSFFTAGYNPVWGHGSSFPSGHAMMAFSVATVFSRRYKEHKWIPFVAYTVATALSFSRVTTGAHFSSDTFIGAAMGYIIARYDVLRGH
jgi:PAP2 superfamily